MKRNDIRKRIAAMALTAVMTVSMTGFEFAEAFAVQDEAADIQTEQTAGTDAADMMSGEEPAGQTDKAPTADDEISDDEIADDEAADVESAPELNEEAGQEEPAAEEEAGPQDQDDVSDDDIEPEPDPEPDPEPVSIAVSVTNKDGVMKLTWPAVENAASYVLTKSVCSAYNANKRFDEGETTFTTEVPKYTFKNLFPGRLYTFTVTALDSENKELGKTEHPVSEQPVISPASKRARRSRSVNARRLSFSGNPDLRTAIGEKYNRYAVMQGGCTDGTYAYYLMVRSSTQHGRVIKVRMSDNKIVKKSAVLDTWHGNGMAYDSRRHELVVIACTELCNGRCRKHEITCIDPDTLTIIKGRQKNAKYTFFKNDTSYFKTYGRSRGFCAIAYNEKYDVYIANQRDAHNLIIIDPDTFEAMGLIMTRLIAKYPGSFQAMDADDQYAYMLLSEDSKQPNNIILALDWSSGQLVDRNGHRRQYVSEIWLCANNRAPVATYKINTPFEAENIYHTTDSSGRTHFYMSEYNPNRQYTYSYRKVPKKVKWKKIKKKKKVKWKKVKKRVKWKKVHGKWKYKTKKVWKYKIKKKKVWKYRTVYKKVTVKKFHHKERRDYVYDLGII